MQQDKDQLVRSLQDQVDSKKWRVNLLDRSLEGKLESDEFRLSQIFERRTYTKKEINYLIGMFSEYSNNPELKDHIPSDLLMYIAKELKLYASNRKYKPFPVKVGSPQVIDWYMVEEHVKDLLKFPDFDDPESKQNLKTLFKMVILFFDLDPNDQIPPNTLTQRIRHFKKEYPDLV